MRKSLFRAYARLRARPLLRRLEEIERTQWLPKEALLELQVARLKELLAHAAREVPYYTDLFRRAGLEPEAVRSVSDLRVLPALDRDTLATRFDDLRARQAGRGALLRSTGGSTGRPVRFLVDRRERAARSAHIYRSLRWLGWDLGDRVAYVWGSDIDSREHRGGLGAARDRLAGVLWLDAFTLSEEDLDSCLERLARFDPAVVVGYPSSLHLLAERALARSRRLKLRGIQTSAEMLAPRVRDDLREAFGCPVLDRYGCREAGVVAHECAPGRMHVSAEAVVMECVEGEVLLTTLDNRAMPLIRYKVEDLAALSDDPCPCGRGLPLVRGLQGRLCDVIRSPGGRLIHGEFFTHLFYEAPGVKRFQVEQTAPERLEIRVVATSAFGPEQRVRLERAIRAHADPAFEVVWRDVADIPPGESGKFRFTMASRRPGGDTP